MADNSFSVNFDDYMVRTPRPKIYTCDEVAPLTLPTPEEQEWYRTTRKLDSNDFDTETLRTLLLDMWEKAPCLYRSDSKRRSARQMLQENPERREYVIDGLLRRGEIMNFVAAPKRGKSWMGLNLAMCVVNGWRWFERYQCAQGKVLLIDNELHETELAWRVNEVCSALGLDADYVMEQIDIIALRGRLVSLDKLIEEVRDVYAGEYKLIILDAFYKLMPPRTDENDNGAMANLYNILDGYARYFDAGMALVHHTTKGNQAQKDVTDMGAGGGVQSRAADTHLVLRPHEEDGCVVMDAAVRSSKEVEKIGLRFEWPIWTYDGNIDITKLKGAAEGGTTYKESHPQKLARIREALLTQIITTEPQTKAQIDNKARTMGLAVSLTAQELGELVKQNLVLRFQGGGAGRQATWRLPAPGERATPETAPTPAPEPEVQVEPEFPEEVVVEEEFTDEALPI